MSSKHVDILMATYNGERYLEQQIKSIQDQTHTAWNLLISDDGSTDSTISLIERIAATDHRIHLVSDKIEHRGACARFMWLLEQAKSDFVMFSDQNDCWFPKKIQVLLDAQDEYERLNGRDAPVIVFSDAEVVDSDLSQIHPSFMKYERLNPRANAFRNLVVCNHAPGCTMLINRPLLDKLRIPDVLSDVVMHDWWLMLVGSTMGSIIYVDEPLIKYRQHESNAEGARSYNLSHYMAHISDVARAHQASQRQANSFGKTYEADLTEENRTICLDYGNTRSGAFNTVSAIMRHKLWEPGFARRIGQLVVPFISNVER